MSAHRWNANRISWRALVFWVWLASFVFGFAASDLFHPANCPEQMALRASGHDTGAPRAQASHSHALQLDTLCPTCLLQLDAQGILALTLVLLAPLFIALIGLSAHSSHVAARTLITSARGPPVSFI